jgi:hypothetical protein
MFVKLLEHLKAIEAEANDYESAHGFDYDNQARMEIAHEMIEQLKANPKASESELMEIARLACLETMELAIDDARYYVLDELDKPFATEVSL